MRVILLVCGLSLTASQLFAQAMSVDKLGWLAGCWSRASGSTLIEEQWMKPRAGIMLGMGRTVRAGKIVDYESMQILERGGTLVYAAQPSGQPAAEFVARKYDGAFVRFENPTHDFPQRVIYGPGAGDSLFARIEGAMQGKQQGIDFRMKRGNCGD